MEINLSYSDSILERTRKPRHQGRIPDANHYIEGVSNSCGDDITLYLKIEDGVIVDGGYEGSGCAISRASADIMLDLIIGKSKDEIRKIIENFGKMLSGKSSLEEIREMKDASVFRDLRRTPSRIKCAMLGWQTIRDSLGE